GRLSEHDLLFLLSFVTDDHRLAMGELNNMRASSRIMTHEGHTAWLRALASAERVVCTFDEHLTLNVLPVDDHIPVEVAHFVPFSDQITRDIIVRPFFDHC